MHWPVVTGLINQHLFQRNLFASLDTTRRRVLTPGRHSTSARRTQVTTHANLDTRKLLQAGRTPFSVEALTEFPAGCGAAPPGRAHRVIGTRARRSPRGRLGPGTHPGATSDLRPRGSRRAIQNQGRLAAPLALVPEPAPPGRDLAPRLRSLPRLAARALRPRLYPSRAAGEGLRCHILPLSLLPRSVLCMPKASHYCYPPPSNRPIPSRQAPRFGPGKFERQPCVTRTCPRH